MPFRRRWRGYFLVFDNWRKHLRDTRVSDGVMSNIGASLSLTTRGLSKLAQSSSNRTFGFLLSGHTAIGDSTIFCSTSSDEVGLSYLPNRAIATLCTPAQTDHQTFPNARSYPRIADRMSRALRLVLEAGVAVDDYPGLSPYLSCALFPLSALYLTIADWQRVED